MSNSGEIYQDFSNLDFGTCPSEPIDTVGMTSSQFFILLIALVSQSRSHDYSEEYGSYEYAEYPELLEFGKRQATDGFRQQALELHNEYRARHGSPPLVLDNQLNQDAQAYAEVESSTNVQKHSCGPCDRYGENLAYTAGTADQPHDAAAATWACKAWYDEIKDYNFQNPNLSQTHKFGHFTALVWKSTRKVGFGVAYGSKISKSGNKMNTVYVVARYLPAGNMWTSDAMRENVQPSQ